MLGSCFLVLVNLVASGGISSGWDGDESRVLFEFATDQAARRWQTVNDGVMGGRSNGRFRITDNDTMEFYGNLSLANNGGFASVRSRSADLNLQTGDVLVAKVRGDGRQYTFNLHPQNRRTAFSYRVKFETREDEWVLVKMPIDSFVATSFGRTIRNQRLDPSNISGVGILLGDKREGSFNLEVEWIKVERSSD